MKQQMLAEVMFDHPDSVTHATTKLNELGFEVEIFDLRDPEGGPHVWTEVTGASELAESEFFDWIAGLANSLGGDVVEAGLASQGPCGARRAVEEEQRAGRPPITKTRPVMGRRAHS